MFCALDLLIKKKSIKVVLGGDNMLAALTRRGKTGSIHHWIDCLEKNQEKAPKEPVNEWSLKIRKKMRVVDRQIRDIQRGKEKVKWSVKDAAKKGQKDVCVFLAKEMFRSRKAVSKLYASKAHMNSVLMGMKNQIAVLQVAGSL